MKKLSNTEAELKNNVSFKTKRVVSFIFSDLFYWNSFSKKKKKLRSEDLRGNQNNMYLKYATDYVSILLE